MTLLLPSLGLLTVALWVLLRSEDRKVARLPVAVAIVWAVLAMASPLGRPLVGLVQDLADGTKGVTEQAGERGSELVEAVYTKLGGKPSTSQ